MSVILMRQHLRQEGFALLGWAVTVGILAFAVAVVFAILPPGFAHAMQPFMQRLPAGLNAFFGGLATVASMPGWVAGLSLSGFVPLAVTVFVALGALSLVVEDRDSGSLEFLLALPVRREGLLAARSVSLILQILSLEAAVWLLSLAGAAAIGHALPAGRLAAALLLDVMAQTALAGTLALLCLALRDPTQAMLVCLALALGLYLLPVFAPHTPVRFLSPFAYAHGAVFLTGGAFPLGHLVMLGLWTVGAFALAVLLYARTDA